MASNPVPTGDFEAETRYFLPGYYDLAQDWAGTDQALYAEACRHGMDLVARDLRTALETSGRASIEKLYRTASHVRFLTAPLTETGDKPWQLYGWPNFTQTNDNIVTHEQLQADGIPGAARWSDFVPRISSFFEKLEMALDGRARAKAPWFGPGVRLRQDEVTGLKWSNRGSSDGYDRGWVHEGRFRRIIINSPDSQGNRYDFSVWQAPNQQQYHFFHPGWIDGGRAFMDHAFAEADVILGQLVAADMHVVPSSDDSLQRREFWQHYARLFHWLSYVDVTYFGTQTITLMTLGGILKSLGYVIQPWHPETDHWMDPLINTPQEYVENLQVGMYGELPPKLARPRALAIDEQFFATNGLANLGERFRAGRSQTEVLHHGLRGASESPFQGFQIIGRLGLQGNRLQMARPEQEPDVNERLDYLVHWLGAAMFSELFGIRK